MEELRANNVTELLGTLRRLDVEIWAEQDRLRCRANKGVLTAALQAEIARFKPELLDFFKRTQRALRRFDIPLKRISRDVPLPASFGQQRLWFLQELDPHSYAYNIPGAVRIYGPLDLLALERTLDALVQRHETLRTSFQLSGGSLVQIIGPGTPVSLEPIDLVHVSKTEQEQRVRDLICSEARRTFAISSGPHWRVCLVQLSQEEHVLIIIQHHIISDGWSLGIFVREMGELYDAFVAGLPSPLPPLSIQYADYAFWQRQWLDGESLQEQLAFWKQHLQAPLPDLNLPTDRPRPHLQSSSGALVGIMLPTALGESVKTFSQREGATLFMTLLAAFKVLLYRYTGQTDLIVGMSNGNRNHVETESLIGFFVNTLALRTRLSPELSFREVVARVRHVALAAYDNQDVPFERLVEELHPTRDLARSPIFQVMFTLHNTPTERLELQNLTLSGLECDIGTSKFDLTLNATDLGHGLVAVLEYNTDLFEASTARRMLAHWQTLIERVMSNPDERISEIPLLSAVEESRTLVEWNDTAASYSAESTLVDLVMNQVRRTPDRIAIEFAGTSLSFRQFAERVDRLAGRLSGAGICRGAVVGVCVGRSPDLIVALLAVMKCGAAYLPLDVELPPKRLEYMLADSGVAVILVDQHTVQRLPQPKAQLILVQDAREEKRVELLPRSQLGPADTAYRMYTSGSTGKPKAVVVSHRAVVNFLESMQAQPGIAANDVLLAVTPITFDISVLELFLPLIAGAQVALADRATTQDPAQLSQRLVDSQATIMQATPAMWKMLIDAGWTGRPGLKALCGGEALPADLARQLVARCGSLWNMYGPTETTVWSAIQPISPQDEGISIGRPIRNTEIYLLDAHGKPVPVGVPGELYIGGVGLADGYFARPRLTAERFIPHPFAKTPGQRLYRTGDLARYLPAGRIEYLGRMDSQVKLRGFRIELGEVESALRADPRILDAVVVLRDVDAAPRLVAYVIPADENVISISEVRTRLAELLPSNMHPSEFVMLTSFPLTPAGKVDRRSLPAPDRQRPMLQDPFAAPRNPLEQSLAEIWKELLPVENIGIHDNFFDLGGNSLLLAQLQRMISGKTGREISLIQLFQFPSIASIAEFFNAQRG